MNTWTFVGALAWIFSSASLSIVLFLMIHHRVHQRIGVPPLPDKTKRRLTFIGSWLLTFSIVAQSYLMHLTP